MSTLEIVNIFLKHNKKVLENLFYPYTNLTGVCIDFKSIYIVSFFCLNLPSDAKENLQSISSIIKSLRLYYEQIPKHLGLTKCRCST
jgi:hypothetical protein